MPLRFCLKQRNSGFLLFFVFLKQLKKKELYKHNFFSPRPFFLKFEKKNIGRVVVVEKAIGPFEIPSLGKWWKFLVTDRSISDVKKNPNVHDFSCFDFFSERKKFCQSPKLQSLWKISSFSRASDIDIHRSNINITSGVQKPWNNKKLRVCLGGSALDFVSIRTLGFRRFDHWSGLGMAPRKQHAVVTTGIATIFRRG